MFGCTKINTAPLPLEDKQSIVTINDEGELIIEQYGDAFYKTPYVVPLNNKVVSYNFSTDKKKISFVMVLPAEDYVLTQKSVGILDLRSGLVTSLESLNGELLSTLYWSPLDNYLISIYGNTEIGTMKIIDLRSDEVVFNHSCYGNPVFSKDEKFLLIGSVIECEPDLPVGSGESSSLVLVDWETKKKKDIVLGNRDNLYYPIGFNDYDNKAKCIHIKIVEPSMEGASTEHHVGYFDFSAQFIEWEQ